MNQITESKTKHCNRGFTICAMLGFVFGAISGAAFDQVPIGLAGGLTAGMIVGVVIDTLIFNNPD